MATAFQAPSRADLARRAVEDYLAASQRKSLLRFITCGSVDDGKSTLIGRLLYDSKLLFEDQLAALRSDSRTGGTQNGALDFALLVDGLGAEREQGITIDVAYRFFATDRRKFIVADTPGHEQYTRNMVTGASTADLAVILVDARKGVLTQTRRHSYLVNLLGIRNVVLAINKMDLVGYDRGRFDAIVEEYRRFAREAGIESFVAIPISGLEGDNIAAASLAMPWYRGPALLEHLESVPVASRPSADPFRMAVQWVSRPDASFRGYAGRIASGRVRKGDAVTILPSGREARVDRIVTFDGDLDEALADQSVTLTFDQEIDCSRGDLIVGEGAWSALADSLTAMLVWMADEPLMPGRSYWLKLGTGWLSASIETVAHVVDVNAMSKEAGRPLALNDIGRCVLRLDRPVPAILYEEQRGLGGFILVDKISHATVAAGMVEGFSQQSRPHDPEASAENRIYWITASSGEALLQASAAARRRLEALGRPAVVLDDTVLRSGLSTDLGNGPEASSENIRRAREVARLIASAGVHVLMAFDVSPGEAFPGRLIDNVNLEQEGIDQWVI